MAQPRSSTSRTSSSYSCGRWFGAIVVLVLAIGGASLPMWMSALLRHMFTTPHQTPWPHGGRLRLIDVGGIPVQPLYSQERFLELRDKVGALHHPQDVWIVSYPKSGTTWTIAILAALLQHPSASLYSGSIQKMTRHFCPQPELPDLGWGDDGFGHAWETLVEWPTTTKGYRCFKSHWPSRDFVVPTAGSSPKFIYVLRTAQDQMVSHWHQVWGMGFHYNTTHHTRITDGWDAFVQDWLDGNVDSGAWFDHVAGWYERWKQQEDDSSAEQNVLLLRYEELQGAPEASIQRVAQFLGLPAVDDEHMARILHLTSYEQMRQADEKDAGLQFMRWLGVLRTTHIRQGGRNTTSSDDELLRLLPSQRAAMERKYEEKLAPLGIPRDWVLR